MHVMVVATKADGADSIRTATRAEHLRFMLAHRDDVVLGGSFAAEDGSWGGMLLVIDVLSVMAARAWVESEPYHRAGLFGDVVLRPFRHLLPEPVAGLLHAELRAEVQSQGG